MRTFKQFIQISDQIVEKTDGKSAKDPGYSLKDWFKSGGWVQTGGKYDGKPCAKQPGQTTKPYCRDPDDRASLDPNEREKRAKKKRREDPDPDRTGSAKIVTQEEAGEKDACYKKVKSRYKVWPSAYASGALVKCRKVGADNWGKSTVKENYTRIQSRGSTYSILLNWKGKYLNVQMFFPQFTRPTKEQVSYEINKIYPQSLVLSFKPSIKDPTKPLLFTGDENGSK
jgi:hypothetical protein